MPTSQLKSVLFSEFLGVPYFIDIQTVTTPGTEKELFFFTVPALTTCILHAVRVCCKFDSRWHLDVESDTIASGLLNAAHPVDDFIFSNFRKIEAGKVIRLKVYTVSSAPITELDAYLQARLIS